MRHSIRKDLKTDANAGWVRVRLGSTLLRLFTRINLLVLVGEELGISGSASCLRRR